MLTLARGLFALALSCAGAAGAAGLRVSAAASLTDALTEVARAWEAGGRGAVELNFGASNTLVRQLAAGAPADVFVSADLAQMETAERAGAIVPGSARVILRNALVVVVPADAAWTPADASELAHARVRRLALADPAVVPAGVYARRWLEGLGLWSAVSERVVPLENVRAALAAVASGNAEIGVVYVTDAASTDRVRVAFRIPAGEAPPVVYPAAVVARSRDREVAAEFVEHLRAPEAQAVFARHGFLPPEPAP